MAQLDPRPSQPLPAGTLAPPFRLPTAGAAEVAPGGQVAPEETLSLEDLRGAPAVLVFYPADFSPVCGDELAIFGAVQSEIEAHGARVVGISVDSAWCHRAFAREKKIAFPLLSDFNPKGEVSRRYRSYREQEGFSERALVVLDREGKVFWSACSPIDVNPGVDGVLDALERLDREQPGAGRQPAGAAQPQEVRS